MLRLIGDHVNGFRLVRVNVAVAKPKKVRWAGFRSTPRANESPGGRRSHNVPQCFHEGEACLGGRLRCHQIDRRCPVGGVNKQLLHVKE